MLHLAPSPAWSNYKKLLIITSSGGGGLIQAANAKEQEARAANPQIEVIRRDVLRDWMGSIIGSFCSQMWNGAQIKGDVAALRFVISTQFLFDYLCWPYFFLRALFLLFKTNVDHVIDTQPLGTSPILKALRIYYWKTGKKVFLQKFLVDLPTKSATHFLGPIKKLSCKDRPFLQLTTIAPLLEDGQTAEEFWQENCRLSDKEIHYQDVFVRQAFRKFQGIGRGSSPFTLFLRVKSAEELSLMKKSFSKANVEAEIRDGEVFFTLGPKDRMITVLLGSQPASEATFNYVKTFLRTASEFQGPFERCYVFVFSAEHQSSEGSLFRKISDYVDTLEFYPQHVAVIPFSFQSDDCIAPLFFRSDLTCTRSGGQTAMELMCVGTGEVCIHSEAKKDPSERKELSLEQLLDGIPGWEAANALYLKSIRGAKIVTPDEIALVARKYVQAESSKDPSMHG